MRKLKGIICVVMLLGCGSSRGQKMMMKWDQNSYINLNEGRTNATKKEKTYSFKTYRDKEVVVRAAYEKLSRKLNDANCPREILEREKKEFICLIKGKIQIIDA